VLVGAFGVLALLLAAIGLYGVVSQSVAQRTHEIGVRMAMGARPGDVQRLVVSQGMKLALVGLAIGLPAAFALAHLLAGLLFGVVAVEPAAFIAIPLILLAVVLLASYLPARSAARVDPMLALRCE
jgi:putative ABC transport system permease protein